MDANKSSGVTQGLLSLGGSTIISILFSFITVGLWARLITEDAMGIYLLILSVVYLLNVFGDVGFQSAIPRFLASTQGGEDSRNVFQNVLGVVLVSLVVVCLLSLLIRPLLLLLFSEQLADVFGFVPLIYCVQALEQVMASVMQGLKLYQKMALVQALNSALNLGMTVIFLVILNGGLEGLLLATVLTSLLVLGLRILMIPLPKRISFDVGLIKQMVRFGLPLQANNILTFVSQRLDVLLLGALATPTAVAYLGMANKIPQNLQRMYQSVYAIFFPHMTGLFAQERQADAAATLNRFLRLATLVTAGSALVTVLFQNEIVLLIFSERYLPSAPGFALFMVVICISVMSALLDYTLIAAGHPGYMPLISLSDTVPSVIATVILIPLFGFMGAIAARLIANIVAAPVSIWGVRREKIGLRVSHFFKPMGFMVVCYGAAAVLGPESVLVRGAAVVAFLVLCAIFGVITSEDVASVLSGVSMRWRRLAFNR